MEIEGCQKDCGYYVCGENHRGTIFLCDDCDDGKQADEFFELMHKSSRAGLHKEIEKMYNRIKDLEHENKELKMNAILGQSESSEESEQ